MPAFTRFLLAFTLFSFQYLQAQTQNCIPPSPANTCEDACKWCTEDLLSNYFESYTALPAPPYQFDCGVIHNPKWFRMIAEGNQMQFIINTFDCTYGYGLQAALYEIDATGQCPSLLSAVACVEQINGVGLLAATVKPGREYALMIDGWQGDQCYFEFFEASGIACIPISDKMHVSIFKSNDACNFPDLNLRIQGATWKVRFYDPATNTLVQELTGGNTGLIPTDLPYDAAYNVKLIPPDSSWIICNDSVFVPAFTGEVLFTIKPRRQWTACVYEDLNQNCLFDINEKLSKDFLWAFKVTDNANGKSDIYYNDLFKGEILLSPPPGDYSISLIPPTAGWKFCPDVQTVQLGFLDTAKTCFGVDITNVCVDPTVDITHGRLRKGTTTDVSVNYCNKSSFSHANIELTVTLDPLLQYQSANPAPLSVNGQLLKFIFPSLDAFTCTDIKIKATVSSSAQNGQSLCSDVQAAYSSNCNPDSLNKKIAYLTVDGICEQDSVVFTIQNQHPAYKPSSPLFYLIFKNGIPQYPSQPVKLDAAGKMTVKMPADGASWHIETEQEAGQTYTFLPAVSVEGCPAGASKITGLGSATALPPTTGMLFDQDCDPVQTPLDPNIKTGLPAGLGSKHTIKAGTDIEYRIEFENTGSDTAFTVVVYDTLPPYLHANTVQPGAAKAPYTFARLSANILRWTFKDIKLPPKSIDPENCRSWFSFRAPQSPGNKPGTVIRNKAWVYFDSETPVATNEYFHTLPSPSVIRYDSTIFVCATLDEYTHIDGKNYPVPGVIVKTSEYAQFVVTERYNLSYKPPKTLVYSKVICQGTNYIFEGDTLYTPGLYEKYLTAKDGCDSLVRLNLFVSTPQKQLTVRVCPNEPYSFFGQILTKPGVYKYTKKTTGSCDTLFQLTLEHNAVKTHTHLASICAGESFEFNGQQLSKGGTYRDTLKSFLGCDSIVTLLLSVRPVPSAQLQASICAGESYSFYGQQLALPGSYETRQPAPNGCDSLIRLDLKVLPSYTEITEAAFCPGETYTFNNQIFQQPGEYTWNLVSHNGCDSIVILHLRRLEQAIYNYTHTMCEGDTYFFNGLRLSENGIFQDTLTAANGCDSLVTLQLEVLPLGHTQFDVHICKGEFYSFFGDTLTQSGAYTQLLTAANGCDSSVILNLRVQPVYSVEIQDAACEGTDYWFNGQLISQTGLYTSTLQTTTGCDSIVNLQFTQLDSSITLLNLEALPGTQIAGVTVLHDTLFYQTFTAKNGCDSTVAYQVHILTSSSSTLQHTTPVFRLYPNPATDRAVWLLENAISGSLILRLRNMLGQTVLESSPGDSRSGTLNVGSLQAGSYQVEVWLEGGLIKIEQLVVVR